MLASWPAASGEHRKYEQTYGRSRPEQLSVSRRGLFDLAEPPSCLCRRQRGEQCASYGGATRTSQSVGHHQSGPTRRAGYSDGSCRDVGHTSTWLDRAFEHYLAARLRHHHLGALTSDGIRTNAAMREDGRVVIWHLIYGPTGSGYHSSLIRYVGSPQMLYREGRQRRTHNPNLTLTAKRDCIPREYPSAVLFYAVYRP